VSLTNVPLRFQTQHLGTRTKRLLAVSDVCLSWILILHFTLACWYPEYTLARTW